MGALLETGWLMLVKESKDVGQRGLMLCFEVVCDMGCIWMRGFHGVLFEQAI